MQLETVVDESVVARPKPHFVVLDGLRGVAALGVVIFHFAEMVIGNYSVLWIGHGFLAVDFFFCLSGFVLGYAYDDRIATMGLGRFLKARLVRLHPMVLLGAVLGLVAFLANPFGMPPGYGAGRVALLFAASVLLIPYGGMPERGRNLFGLNAPAWTLFWEYVANLVFALVLYRARRATLAVLTVAAAVLLCWVGHRSGNLAGGWSSRNFWDGGARVAYSFMAGLLVYRMGWRVRTPLGFGGLSVLLALALVMPWAKGAWVREAAVIVVYFPLLIALGAGAVISPRVERVCRWSGAVSYPLYMSHYAVMWMWGDFAEKHRLADGGLWSPIALGVLCMLVFGWAVLKLYDEPVRAWLHREL
ncbi:acyltransferase [Acidipila sp. EB88]|uniref:acyltransferase family protein n=1 Tax=Acidipila sp. EB88 TaxID=2305226 RepID=UPI000F5EE9E6|nr:acyltransferase [Acidipila sp. EB88]RRA47748.1 acyltransferase [Acidipila sp. EB88]